MRFAFVLSSLNGRSALEAGPVDLEWLQGLAAGHDLELFVDQSTAASETLRQAGLPVSVSIKRPIELSDGRRISADALQARALRRSHELAPFDAVVYGSDVTVDFAWFEPALRPVPRGVALGAGFAHDLRVVWEDRRLFAGLARRMWSLTGLVASADFLLSEVPPESFGLVEDGALPPWYRPAVEPAVEPTVEAAVEPEPAESRTTGTWVAVAATAAGYRSAESLVGRVVERLPPENGTTYIILTRPPLPDGHPIDKALLESCPDNLRRRIVVVAAGDDRVAADFLDRADVVVLESPAELAVPAVASAARRRGQVQLRPPASRREPVGVFPGSLPTPARQRGGTPGGGLQVLTWSEPAAKLRREVEEIAPEMGEDDLLVLHAHGRAGPAVRLFGLPDLRGVDVVVWGQPDATLGNPEPGVLYPYALAVRGAAVPAVARAIEECESIWELVCWAVSPEWIDRHRLLVLPASFGAECWEIRDVDHIATSWYPGSGILPPPRWIPTISKQSEPAAPEPVYLPRRRFLPPPTAPTRVALEAWARRSRWWERIRLGLPWKWGLLDRAMKGRW